MAFGYRARTRAGRYVYGATFPTLGCPALVVRLQRPRLARTLGKVLIDAALFEGWKLDAWVH